MKKLITFIYILLLSCVFLESQDEFYRAQGWNSLSKAGKLTLYHGYQLGQLMVLEDIRYYEEFLIQEIDKTSEETKKGNLRMWKKSLEAFREVWHLQKLQHPNTSPDQIIDGIDEFYKDYANRHIRLDHAISLVIMRINGKSEGKIKGLIEHYRKIDRKNTNTQASRY